MLITATVLRPGEVIHQGQVLVDAAGMIQCVGCDCATAPGAMGATAVVCPQGVVSPGLINAHDHLTFAQNAPYTRTAERYEHRHHWRRGSNGHTRLRSAGSASNDQVAWDAVQEGMVSALRNAERFRGDSAVASWLYSIVVNAALYQRRRATSRRRGMDRFVEKVWPDAELSLEAGTVQHDPEAHLMAKIDLERVSDRIAELPADRRELLERALGGDSFQDIADSIGEPVAAVKSRVWRTRVGLRAEFGEALAAA